MAGRQWLCVLSCGILLSISTASDAGAQQPADATSQAIVHELYAARLARARSTRDPADDLELAREMLAAAADPAGQAPIRMALAAQALELAAPVGTADGAQVARDALNLAHSLRPMAELDYWQRRRELALTRLAGMSTGPLTGEERERIVREAVEAILAVTDAMPDDADPRTLRAELLRAQQIAAQYRLADVALAIRERVDSMTAEVERYALLDQARQSLEAAQAQANPALIQAARLRLVTLHLQFNGDLAAAAGYAEASGHAHAAAILQAAAYLENPLAMEPAGLLETAEGLAALAAALGEEVGQPVATVGLEMVARYLGTVPAGEDAARAGMLRTRLEVLAKQTPADRLLAALEKGYGALHGNIAVLDAAAGRIRVRYDFARSDQLDDFMVSAIDVWGITRSNALGGYAPNLTAQAATKLIFDGTRPVTIRFRASGPRDLGLVLNWSPTLPFAEAATPFLVSLGYSLNRFGHISGPGGRPYSDPRMTVDPDEVYRERIEWDGRGTITWSVNDRQVAVWTSTPNPRTGEPKYIRPALQLTGGPTAFDDVEIEACVVLDPVVRPVAPPPGRPQEPPPPRPRIIRMRPLR